MVFDVKFPEDCANVLLEPYGKCGGEIRIASDSVGKKVAIGFGYSLKLISFDLNKREAVVNISKSTADIGSV